MSILNFIDGSIPIGTSQNTTTSIVNLTGPLNTTITLTFSKSGNIATITVPFFMALETGSGGYATGSITFPEGFEPAALPYVDNNVLGIVNVSLRTPSIVQSGIVQISNGNLQVGNFYGAGTTINNLGLYNDVVITYITSSSTPISSGKSIFPPITDLPGPPPSSS